MPHHIEKRCFYCMNEISGDSSICPSCNKNNNIEHIESNNLIPGTILFNRYLVGVSIGAGGFGITYIGYDYVLQRKVAIKEYLPGELSARSYGEPKVTIFGGENASRFDVGMKRFHDESVRLAKLQNQEGIVQIYDTFEENNTAYIVMELLEGETLEARLKRENTIDSKAALEIIGAVLETLKNVHSEGILHRDIAPNNIYLCNDGTVKLLDFGSSKDGIEIDSENVTVLIKDGYTAAEQYRGNGEQGPWTDVYSCAATLYRMLTGKIPPSAMDRVLRDTIKSPSQSGAKVSKKIDIAIMNALNVDASIRTKSAEEFSRELFSAEKIKKHYVKTAEKKVGQIPKEVVAVLLAAFIGSGVFLTLAYMGKFDADTIESVAFDIPGGQTRVVSIVNMDLEKAKSLLEGNKLLLIVDEEKYNKDVNDGCIISQSIDKGSIVDVGSVVHVTVCNKAARVTVPWIEKMSWEDAKILLDDKNIKYVLEYENSEDATNHVVRQAMPGGFSISQDEEFVVTLSENKNNGTEEMVQIPNVEDLDYFTAKDKLAEVGLYLQIKEYSIEDNLTIRDWYINQTCNWPEEEVKSGTVLYCNVSLKERYKLPDMTGYEWQYAIDALTSADIYASVNYVIDKSAPEGTVVGQSIAPGKPVHARDKVVIDVCKNSGPVINFVFPYNRGVDITDFVDVQGKDLKSYSYIDGITAYDELDGDISDKIIIEKGEKVIKETTSFDDFMTPNEDYTMLVTYIVANSKGEETTRQVNYHRYVDIDLDELVEDKDIESYDELFWVLGNLDELVEYIHISTVNIDDYEDYWYSHNPQDLYANFWDKVANE